MSTSGLHTHRKEGREGGEERGKKGGREEKEIGKGKTKIIKKNLHIQKGIPCVTNWSSAVSGRSVDGSGG